MELLSLGLILFLGVHLVPTLPALKASLVRSLGENPYKGLFSLVSAAGLVLIVIGYARAPAGARLFTPSSMAIMIAPLAMLISFILLAAANMKTHIRASIKHPMLLGVGIWALVHLLANGHAKAAVLFGAFLAYVVIDLMSALRRKTGAAFAPKTKHDVIAVVSGTLLALLVMAFHRMLFGPAVVNWGF